MKNYLDKEFEYFDSLPCYIFSWPETKDFDANWMQKYKYVNEFAIKNGRLPFETSKDFIEKKHGQWCQRQRANYKNPGINKFRPLSKTQIKSLESIPGWFWEVDFDANWMEKYEYVKEFAIKNSRLPSNGAKDLIEKRHAKWCSWQRLNFNNPGINKFRPLSKTQIKSLESIAGWYWQQDFYDAWMERYQFVKEFTIKNVVFPSKKSKDSIEKKHGMWCADQRKNYKNPIICKRRPLTETQIKLLESLEGWYWSK